MEHEKNIPAQQKKTQEDLRFSSSHEDQKGPSCDQPQKTSRTQKTSRLTLSKKSLLRTKAEYLRVIRSGQKFPGSYLRIDYRVAVAPLLGLSVSKHFGGAVKRNRFKRLVREVFRELRSTLPPVEMNIAPKPHIAGVSKKEIMLDFSAFKEHVTAHAQ